jgi:hypothetical protein
MHLSVRQWTHAAALPKRHRLAAYLPADNLSNYVAVDYAN